MTPAEHQFLDQVNAEAAKAGHVWPEMAACEAALESGYGRSLLAIQYHNLFGTKQHAHPVYGTHVLPTREFLDGKWISLNSSWIVYPDVAACFADRMVTLERLASFYPAYRAALAAPSATGYIFEVSKTWSTDPKRAEKVLAIYEAVAGDWNAT